MRLRNPNLGPNSVKQILDTRILDPNSWVECFDCFFQQKRPPEKFTVEKFTSQNSPSKIQPRNRTKKFTVHFCRAARPLKNKQKTADNTLFLRSVLTAQDRILKVRSLASLGLKSALALFASRVFGGLKWPKSGLEVA